MGKKKEEFYFVFGLVKIKLRANIQRDREKKKESLMTTSTQCHSLDLVLLYSRAVGRSQDLEG